jgi:ELWxxDGT repeat protein
MATGKGAMRRLFALLGDAGTPGQGAARGGAVTPIKPVLDGRVFFMATGPGAEGYELWRSDGTKPGTKLVKNIRPGVESSFPNGFTRLGKRLLFAATGPDGSYELWRTDGTAGGTKRLKDINPTGDSQPRSLARFGDIVVFSANDGTHGA